MPNVNVSLQCHISQHDSHQQQWNLHQKGVDTSDKGRVEVSPENFLKSCIQAVISQTMVAHKRTQPALGSSYQFMTCFPGSGQAQLQQTDRVERLVLFYSFIITGACVFITYRK